MMLYYNIYTYINDQEFLEIRNKLIPIEKKMADELFLLGWGLTESVKKNDALIIDFIFQDRFFMGNIGFVYIDEPGGPVFSFYVTKSYDELENRYFVKQFISENESLSFYDQNIDLILDKAIELYKLWDKDYVYENNINY
ncbi:hypothetical protein DU508_13705 [Pedobacter chinensis]|uniref:Uncharacterized protein n=1 Tax=Pedobacter chinensis TaxID=2282421 RepID=A0A369PUI2_9SPHI|nr:hypothetical protein [Pedobacter chinensis]RDC55920.1 hypothetical protein DU508_13705 [Pedobacter chinensis]